MRKYYINRLFILFAVLLPLFFSCRIYTALSDSENISISLPTWPPQEDSFYPPLSRWKIVVTDYRQSIICYTTSSNIELEVQKNFPLCILAYPITLLDDGCECQYFYPAGYIYPSEKSNNALSWEQGYPAHIMNELYKCCKNSGASPSEAARYVSTFNWEKAASYIDEKINKSLSRSKFYNPWLCDMSRIMQNLSDQNFMSSLLSPTSCYTLSTDYIFEQTGIHIMSPFIPENQNIRINHQITVKKETPLILSDLHKIGIFVNFESAKNVLIEYIYIPIYNEEP